MDQMALQRELDLRGGEMLLVAKPKGWTSFDVVNKIRGLFHLERVGHAGTLDPMATGLLIVCTGKKTKDIDRYGGLEKEYRATLLLGARTESFDAETPVVERHTTEDITEEMIRACLSSFEGYQTQIPPMWSAAKVGGKRLYKYARKGMVVSRKPREVCIRSIVPHEIRIPEVSCTISCSKGTYVRTLVDDIGRRLACGAYLAELERTRIGEYMLQDAVTVEELIQYRDEHRRVLQ